jgi:Leu/Phe-tRNA-protein transferase
MLGLMKKVLRVSYPLHYTLSGHIFIDPGDDCDALVDAMLETGYDEEFCIAADLDPPFVARLMRAGFLVMSVNLEGPGGEGEVVLLPKLHRTRAVLSFPELHIKKSIGPFLGRYELRFDSDFETIVDRCVALHGGDWLTGPLVGVIKALHADPAGLVRPASFALYRGGILRAGEFGVVCGGVYTSYSGYYEESNAGTVQMILMVRYLERAGFAFLDLGMPLPYKDSLGARNIGPKQFTALFRNARV